MNIAIVGATGNVGRKLLEVIEKLNFQFSDLYLIASDKSIGKKINFKKKTYSIIGLSDFDFSKVKIAFFSAGSSIAEKWVPVAAKKTIVIDNSKQFRMDKEIPLVVPEVNSDILKNTSSSLHLTSISPNLIILNIISLFIYKKNLYVGCIYLLSLKIAILKMF